MTVRGEVECAAPAEGRAVAVSLVVPVYAGEAYLAALVERVGRLRRDWAEADAPMALTELILVDDAARDGSGALIDALGRDHPWIVPLHLSRNFGQHAATVAGILHSAGDWVVTLDEDLQHPPERVPDILALAARDGADVVYAKPGAPPHGGSWRDASSQGFKRLMQALTGIPHLRHVNSFRLIRGPMARAAAQACGHDTYFDVNLSWFTQRVRAVEMALTDTRFAETGGSGYSLRALIRHAFRMLYSSQLRFLGIGLGIGATLCAVALLGGLYFLGVKLIAPERIGVQGWTSLVLLICFTSGMMAAMLGRLLRYMSTLVLNVHGKPVFFVVDRSGDAALAAWFAAREAGP